MIKIFDKLVSQQNQLYFKNIISSDEFPWYFPKGNDQTLMHTLYSYPRGPQSSYHKQFKALFDALEEKANIKIVQLLKMQEEIMYVQEVVMSGRCKVIGILII